MEISATGEGDYTTWCNLLVSSGDTSISTAGFDTNRQLTAAQAAAARNTGFTHIGRYVVGASKYITSQEFAGLRTAGFKLFPIHQRFNNSATVMTRANGLVHGREALDRARVFGLPHDTTMFFAVDFDAQDPEISGPVMDYFRGVNDALAWAIERELKVGIYGTRNVCQRVIDAGLASAAFVAGMSTGYSGNMGFRMPDQWHYNQIVELPIDLAGTSIPIDKDVVSSRAASVDLTHILPPPVEREGAATDTGFDAVFEWVCRAEIECERALSEASSPLQPLQVFVGDVPSIIAHSLRLPTYWGGLMWPIYTPRNPTSSFQALAEAACLQAIDGMAPAKPVTSRDVEHFAATFLGYHTWGLPSAVDSYGVGDLGGWALDLLQAWGNYKRASSSGDVYDWMVDNIGVSDASGFGYADVAADADAYLIAWDRFNTGFKPFSESMRQVYQSGPSSRISEFYQLRFGGDTENVATAFKRLITGPGVLDPIPLSEYALRRAAGLEDGDPMPTEQEAELCGRALAQKLETLGT
ncbi:glycoside hydrolase domain-containing protein [Pseudactinotalea sp. Z1748]|uniref:glycoside hydrolase domain-containing protein n=1 Tax=Pseudactinotalea sp. Z1748 TaxID=3413027 RepID=UPI003C7AB05F